MTYAVATQNRRKFYLSNNIDDKMKDIPGFDKNLINHSSNNNLNAQTNFFMSYDSKRLISPTDCNTVMRKLLDETSCDVPIRILLVTKLDKENDIKSFYNLFSNAAVQYKRMNRMTESDVSPVEISVVNLGKIDIEKIKVKIEYTPVECDNFAESLIKEFINLVKKHYNLVMTSVSKIPMKEQEGQGKSTEYNVGLLHKKPRYWKETYTGNELKLAWNTPKIDPKEIYACVDATKICPVDVSSRQSMCLTNFILQNKRTVLLNKSTEKKNTHLLTCHGGDIYLHTLISGTQRKTKTSGENDEKLLTDTNPLIKIRTTNLGHQKEVNLLDTLQIPSLSNSSGANCNRYRLNEM